MPIIYSVTCFYFLIFSAAEYAFSSSNNFITLTKGQKAKNPPTAVFTEGRFKVQL